MPETQLTSILICGQGLAGQICLSALERHLTDTIKITYLDLSGAENFDALYGSTLRPTAYDFHLKLGISEPELLQKTRASFSFGNGYRGWGGNSWMQCFHAPFPVWDHVPFHHYITRTNEDIQAYLISAIAAKAGVFAHPPQDPKVALSRAEYGYHIAPAELAALLADKSHSPNVSILKSQIKNVTRGDKGEISSITLSDGRSVSADFYIDGSGPSAELLPKLDAKQKPSISVKTYVSQIPTGELGPPMSVTQCSDFGWQSDTPLKGAVTRMTLSHPSEAQAAMLAHGCEPQTILSASLGQREAAWSGNCAGIGHAVLMAEPLTPAPLILLQKDIERLLDLIPISTSMAVERREYNRRYKSEVENALLFQRSFFDSGALPQGAYWTDKAKAQTFDKLTRKTQQFESRGHFVAYDHEAFNQEDWAILHYGMGRRPNRYDIKIDLLDQNAILKRLDDLKASCEKIAAKMPPHKRYMTNYLKYLEKTNG